MEKVWLKNYPQGVPHELPKIKNSLAKEFERVCKEFDKKPAFISFNKKLSYRELYDKSRDFASYLQAQGFKKNEVFVIQLPNLLQYPVALWGGVLAGLRLVNMNPLYSAQEMLLPLKETQAKGIILLSNKLKDLEKILDQTFLEQILVTSPGDLLDFPKKQIFNFLWKYKSKSWRYPKKIQQHHNKNKKSQPKNEIHKATNEKYDSKSKIYQSKSGKCDSKSKIYQSENEKCDSKSEIYQSESEKCDSKSEIYQSENGKYDSKSEIYQSESEKCDSKSKIYQSESEKCESKSEIYQSKYNSESGRQLEDSKNISCIPFSYSLKNKSYSFSVIPRDKEDTVFIQYTGGTTGVIKGVCLTENNILSNIKQCELWMRSYVNKGEEVALAALPLGHIFSFLVNGLVFFCNGYSNVLIANPKKIRSMVSVLKKQKISIGTGLNTLFKALLKNKNFKKLDFSALKFFISGGMALQADVQKEWEACTQSHLIEGYGLTESSPVVCVDRLDQPNRGFVGYPLPSTEIRITNSEAKELDFNQEGELEVRGPQVMKGYYKNEKESSMVLNSQGWLKTGDIAKVSPQGLIQIVDRKKDMINISGFKVYPNEIEEVLLSHPQIKDSAVIGVKDKHNREYIKAFVIKTQEPLSKEQIVSYCKKNLAPYKIPKQIGFCKNLPKNFIGKTLRRSIKTEF